MWLSLAMLVVFAGIAYVYSIQGLFSALIAFVYTLLAACLAFAGFELLAPKVIGVQPGLALSVSFLGIFIVSLILFRTALDAIIRRQILIPLWVDRVGGGLFGILAGLITTGMLALSIQMLSFGGDFLGFARFAPIAQNNFNADDYVRPEERRPLEDQQELWLTPDRFTVGLASMMGSGVFSGTRDWKDIHPDFVTSLGLMQATKRGVSTVASPGSISLISAGSVDYVYWKKQQGGGDTATYEYNQVAPQPGHKWFAVHFSISKDAADKDNQHRFMIRQIRLVGRDGPESSGLVQYTPRALSNDDPAQSDLLITWEDKLDSKFRFVETLYKAGPEDKVAFAFEVPSTFIPEFVEYKGLARADLSAVAEEEKEGKLPQLASLPKPDASAAPPPAPAPEKPSDFQGRITGARGRTLGTRFGDAMPVSINNYSIKDPEVNRGNHELIQGSLLAYLDEPGQGEGDGKDALLEKLAVPSEKRLLHFSTDNLRAGSTLGKAKSFVVKTLEEYKMHAEDGTEYTMVGKYAIANVDGREVFELQYFPEYASSGARTHKAFDKIKDRHLEGDYTLVFLYLVDPGTKLVKFTTGGSANLAQDLSSMNIVAPQ